MRVLFYIKLKIFLNSAAIRHSQVLSLQRFKNIDIMKTEKMECSICEKLQKAEKEAHLISAELIALENKNEVLEIIQTCSTSSEELQASLEARFNLDHVQSKRILDMSFESLAFQQADEKHQEYNQVLAQISALKDELSKK